MESKRIERLRDSYIEHVRLIIEADDRAANLRDFLDPWWVYDRELSRGSAKARSSFIIRCQDGSLKARRFNFPCAWTQRERLPKFDFVSDDAQRIIDFGQRARIADRRTHPLGMRLVVDHVVPFAYLRPYLFGEAGPRGREQIADFLSRHFLRGVISKADDQKLTEQGWAAAMPRHWQFESSNAFARYEGAGIGGRRYAS